MTTFQDALKLVLKFEGGAVDDPQDPGGRTNQGVTQKTYDDYRGRLGQIKKDVFLIEPSEVEAIYREGYWTKARCDELPQPVAVALFDYAVNSGVAQATKSLQRVLGVAEDGILGPRTLAKVRAQEAKMLARSLIRERSAFLDRLIAQKPVLVKFQRGWKKRLDELEDYVVHMA